MIDYSSIQVPGPTITDLSRPFWDGVQDSQLMLQLCDSCQQHVFYPRPLCPHCWRGKLDWVSASGHGTLKSFSQIWKPGHPGWLPAAPYVVGLVLLAEGPTMLSHILVGSHTPCVGDPLVFAPTKVAGRELPFFQIIK